VRDEGLDCLLAGADQHRQHRRAACRRSSTGAAGSPSSSIASPARPAISSTQLAITHLRNTSETELASSPGLGISGASACRTSEAVAATHSQNALHVTLAPKTRALIAPDRGSPSRPPRACPSRFAAPSCMRGFHAPQSGNPALQCGPSEASNTVNIHPARPSKCFCHLIIRGENILRPTVTGTGMNRGRAQTDEPYAKTWRSLRVWSHRDDYSWVSLLHTVRTCAGEQCAPFSCARMPAGARHHAPAEMMANNIMVRRAAASPPRSSRRFSGRDAGVVVWIDDPPVNANARSDAAPRPGGAAFTPSPFRMRSGPAINRREVGIAPKPGHRRGQYTAAPLDCSMASRSTTSDAEGFEVTAARTTEPARGGGSASDTAKAVRARPRCCGGHPAWFTSVVLPGELPSCRHGRDTSPEPQT